MAIDTRLFNQIPDEATQIAVIELWKAVRDAVREINETVDGMNERITNLENTVAALAAQLQRRG